jgi:hypothetical protein
MRSAVALLLCLSSNVLAQHDPPHPDPKEAAPTQDPKAWALLDAADALLGAPVASGLKDVTYLHRLHHLPGVGFKVTWVAPNHAKGELRLGSDIAPGIRAFVEQQEKTLIEEVVRAADVVVGTRNRDAYGGDALSLVGERKVKVEARSPRSKARFRDVLITFDDRGLPTHARHRTSSGEIDMTVTFQEHGKGRFAVDTVESRVSAGRPTTMRFTYEAVGPYLFVKQIVAETPSGRVIQTFEEFQVDQGLKPPL